MSEIDITTVAKPIEIKQFDDGVGKDLLFVMTSLLKENGMVGHHIRSANNFYTNGIKQIITQGFNIRRDIINKRRAVTEDKKIDWISCEVIPSNVEIKPPTYIHYRTGKEQVLFPTAALVNEKLYSGALTFDCEIKATAYNSDKTTSVRTAHIKSFQIGKVPIIKGSVMCNTYGKSKEALMRLGEDPSDPGGYFIVRGEYATDNVENIAFNQPRVYANNYKNTLARCEFISKPGDGYQNSGMIILQYQKDSTFLIEISRDKLTKVQIPFFLLFRAFGWSNDKDLLDWIIYDYDSPANKEILNIIINSINAKYGKENYRDVYNNIDALKMIVNLIPEDMNRIYDLRNHPDNYHNAIQDVTKTFDLHCLPHIGMTSTSRHEKLKFLALLIRKTLLVWLGYVPQTDRDSYRNKRIHSAGESYSKTFKQFFQQSIVTQIHKYMLRHFNSTPFNAVNLTNIVRSAINTDEFEKVIVQTINAGNKSSLKIGRKVMINRLSAQLLNRKNQMSALATLRHITATSVDSAKQSERASEMRRVHMSQIGYVCVTHSPTEGEKVGVNKQMAIFSFIAPASSSEVLKKIIEDDKDVIRDTPEQELTPLFIYRSHLARVYVNGHLVGYTKDSVAFTQKYRKKRRQLEINPYTTVFWDNVQNEIHLYVDIGRICRALFIVYNNKRDTEYKGDVKEFEQGLGITKEDINKLYRGEITCNDLLREQKIEYITPDEQENCYVCPNFEQLLSDKNNELKEYTHCDVPQSILGITALTTPFGNHNAPPRVTYQTAQGKQTCGYYILNWAHRIDNETYLQFVNEKPLITTLSNNFLFPNGNNIMVAIACYTGSNQEDSLIINKAASERLLYLGCKCSSIKTELTNKEELGTPDASKTDSIKDANYNKLVNGVVPVGTRLNADDVVIGKYAPLPKGSSDKYAYTDMSVLYRSDEEALVSKRVIGRNDNGESFVKIGLQKMRPIAVGDKFSSRAGQKGTCSLLMREADLLTTIDGIRPVAIFNPHGMPSRMTCSQLIESHLGNICAVKGTHFDGTMFEKVDIETVAEELAQRGFNRYGYDRMISGITGEYVDSLIFFGPTYYQRLQKFVKDAEYSVRHALTDALTMQPLSGQGSSGGLKVGEMERDVLSSHGAMFTLYEKFFLHSDGMYEYICRCGRPAIVNHKQNIYKCNYCGNNADIVAIPSSYSGKLFNQEINTMNVGTARIPRPFSFPKNDDGTLSTIDEYNDESIMTLLETAEEMIEDDGVVAED